MRRSVLPGLSSLVEPIDSIEGRLEAAEESRREWLCSSQIRTISLPRIPLNKEPDIVQCMEMYEIALADRYTVYRTVDGRNLRRIYSNLNLPSKCSSSSISPLGAHLF